MKKKVFAGMILIVLIACAGVIGYMVQKEMHTEKPEELLVKYMNHISDKEYEKMYDMLETESVSQMDKEAYIKRNSNIYEGMETTNLKIENIERREDEKRKVVLTYDESFDTAAGPVSFQNEATFVKVDGEYRLVWDDGLIYPGLESIDRVVVSTLWAERGSIIDRNGEVLAGKGTASSVGIVPGKFDKEGSIMQLAELLELDAEAIEQKLSASWVNDDSFVPIKTISKSAEQEQLLAIPGVMISDMEVRHYALGAAAAHLVGYVQKVTAEDLEEHAGEGYSSNSVIGRSGIEGLCETRLKGQDGCEIYITSDSGVKKEVIAITQKEDGENIKLTIDASLQKALYEQFQEDKGCSVAMNPYTGEVLALVSTPAYDNNDFIMGLSDAKWTSLNEDEKKPMYNRFRQKWCPGSTFKPIIAAIGMQTGTVNPDEDFGNVGLRWQKDASWGSYYVTTLHDYSPVIMENALIYSDNIYFAKAALQIGRENLEQSLSSLGFNQELPFEIVMEKSQYSNSENIETEIQLADSGYGQGEVLVNPLHLASLYTFFLNDGNVIKPYIIQEEGKGSEVWISQAFSSEVSGRVLEGMKQVVNNPHGTGYAAHRDDIVLAGKTGTAEIKASQEDTTGTELGWFCIFTTEEDAARPVLILSMVEDVKDRGGSGYVVRRDKIVLDTILTE